MCEVILLQTLRLWTLRISKILRVWSNHLGVRIYIWGEWGYNRSGNRYVGYYEEVLT